jgi:hypothetical protein
MRVFFFQRRRWHRGMEAATEAITSKFLSFLTLLFTDEQLVKAQIHYHATTGTMQSSTSLLSLRAG